MATKLRAGSRIEFEIVAQSPDTLLPISGLPVFLDFIESSTAAPVAVSGAETDGNGRARVATTLPSTPGSYKYRSRTPGIAEQYRSDVSSQLTIEVVAV